MANSTFHLTGKTALVTVEMAVLASGWRRHWPNPVPIYAYGVKTKKKTKRPPKS